MAQHFLLSAAAKTLSLKAVMRMSEEEAHEAFRQIRWADTAGEPYCPRCGCFAVYGYTTRRLWKCKGCCHQFSATSGTIFAGRKLAIRPRQRQQSLRWTPHDGLPFSSLLTIRFVRNDVQGGKPKDIAVFHHTRPEGGAVYIAHYVIAAASRLLMLPLVAGEGILMA